MLLFLTEAAQPNRHLQNLAHPPMQRSTSCHLLVLRTRCWAPPCPKTLSEEFVRERQMVRCAGGVRGPRRLTRQGSSHCNPQITLTMSQSSPPKPGGAKMGQGEEVSRTQHRDGHVPAMRTWLIHERCLSVLIAQARGTAIVTIRWSQETTTSRNTRAGSHLWKDARRSWSSFRFALLENALLKVLKRPGEVAARPQNEELQHAVRSSTGQQPPLTRRNTNAVLLSCKHSRRFAERLGS